MGSTLMEKAISLNMEFKRSLDFQERYFAYFRKSNVQVFHMMPDKNVLKVSEVFSYPYNPAKIDALVKKIQGYDIRSLDLILPREFFVCKRLMLPSTDFKQARKMALLKLPKYSPFPVEESVAEVTYTGKGEEGYLFVNLWIINKKILYKYLYLLGKSGIAVNHIRMDIDGLPYLVQKSEPKNAPYMVLLFNKGYGHLTILKNGHILNSRMFIVQNEKSSEENDQELYSYDIIHSRIKAEAGKFIKYIREESPSELPVKILFLTNQIPSLMQEESIEGIPLEKTAYKDMKITLTPQLKEFPIHTVTAAAGRNNMNFLP